MSVDEELPEEQGYFDEAAEYRETMRQTLGKAPGAAATTGSATHIRKLADQAMLRLKGPGDAVAFGRFDQDGEHWYVGYHAIHDGENNHVVVNWAAPIAAPYYEATPRNPLGLEMRRDFTCDGNHIENFEDFHFATLEADYERITAEPTVSDALLDDLGRRREGEMHDIVRTIQAAQYQLIRDDVDQLMVVQGGPGTGKTAVALHRVAWLLYNNREQLQPGDFLIIAPNQTFLRYIAQVLPSLGDDNVRQLRLADLVSGVRLGLEEDPAVARIKGDVRMTGLIERGLADRIGRPESEDLSVTVSGTRAAFDNDDLDRQIARFSGARYAVGRGQLRDHMRNIVRERVGVLPANDQQIENLVDRIWPQLSPQAFLQDLLGSRDRLLSAATGASGFSAEDVQLLYRQAAERIAEEQWSASDVPLLDYVNYRMTGPPETTYRHIVVDEVQDLSPMELAMIARRSVDGSMTVLGDLAQSTGAWARDSWDQVIEYLQTEFPANVVELEYGYRVPRQVFEYASQLLPIAAPGLTPPKVVRLGPAEPELIQEVSDNIGDGVVAATQRYVSKGLNVGVICPATYWDNVTDAFRRHGVEWADARTEGIGGPISVLPPLESKGLEFDAIVVVEPVDIVKEAPRGERLLYVALTRTTRYLSVVHTDVHMPVYEPAPRPASRPSQVEAPRPSRPVVATLDRNELLVTTFADSVVDEIRSALHPSLWSLVVAKIQEALPRSIEEPSDEPEQEE